MSPIESTFTAYFTADAEMVLVEFGEAPPPAFADRWMLALDSVEGGCTWRTEPSGPSARDVAAVLDLVEGFDPDLYPIVVAAAAAERDLLANQGVPRG